MPDTVIVTDTSTIAIFDEDVLRHCLDYDGDWWTCANSPELLRELKSGNLYLIDTGMDGRFDVAITLDERMPLDTPLNVRSGILACVCGEEIPAEGLFPEFIRGGIRVPFKGQIAFVRHSVDGARVTINVSTGQEPE
jgi:hypothetical protein